MSAPTILPFDQFRLRPGGSLRFEGRAWDAGTSFFVVIAPTGKGADRHRHPYPETFIVLEGEIEAIIDGASYRTGAGTIIVIPADSWHEFKAVSTDPARLVNIHPVPEMSQEDWSGPP
jgi:quercetin dioxygenase-like cupin family protein